MIGAEGEQIGIIPTAEALQRAQELGLDLVEVSPTSRPPVCRILDFGKFRYELAKKDKMAKKKQHSFQLKEMRYRPKIDEHDFQFKTKHVRNFIEAGSKVKVFVMFRGREMAHVEFGRDVLDRVAKELEDIANVETIPRLDGRKMNMVVSPKPEIFLKMKKEAEAKKQEQKKIKDITEDSEKQKSAVEAESD